MEKVLVTGANGYLGACIFHQLSKNKVVDKLQGRLDGIQPSSLNYDLVIHCAGALRYRTGQHYKANTEGTRRLIKGLNTGAKIVYISSKSIYGTDLEGTLTEHAIPQPSDDYGTTKYRGELAILESGHPYLIIRPSTLFGIGVRNFGPAFPSLAMQQLYHGNDINLFTPDVLHEYLYVWDLVAIVLKLIDKIGNWNTIFNASGRKRSLHTLIYTIGDFLQDNTHHRGKIKQIDDLASEGFFLDTTRLEKAIGKINYTSDEAVVEKMGNYIFACK